MFLSAFEKGIKDARECLEHSLNHSTFNDGRRYRRGKNRCNRCGLRTTPEDKPKGEPKWPD